MKRSAIVALVIAGSAGLAACETEPESSPLSRLMEAQRSFQEADSNEDGVVTPGEAGTVPNLNFAAADTDRNGALTPEEFEVAVVRQEPVG